VLPKADPVLVAPATFNTINKWALGISDNLALGILNEALGLSLPILACPYAKAALTAHPVYGVHVRLLNQAGTRLLSEDAPRTGDELSWEVVRDEMRVLLVSGAR
jgi:phosphopantothenoylcysteine decarboxylase